MSDGVRRAHPAVVCQPGLGAVHGLVEQARREGQRVELTVEGEPGPLPASVELAAYRVIEDSLEQRRTFATSRDPLEIHFSFREHELVLVLSEAVPHHPAATIAIRERVAACHGDWSERAGGDGGRELRITLPTDAAAVFA
ncbi:MAG: hypothetical protein ACXVRX_05915 [Solirubrobacteraceae bacterium]